MLRPRKRSIKTISTSKLIASEYAECKAFWEYVCLKGMDKDFIKHASERIGDPAWYVQALCRIGFRKGVPDYQYIVANDKYHGLWLEFKRSDQRSRKKPPEQQAMIDRLLERNHFACFVYNSMEAIDILNLYIDNKL